MRFDDLSDTAWRVFTSALMWSADNGTDGFIPRRYLRMLHPEGEKPEAIQELIKAKLCWINGQGLLLPEWDGFLHQSTALEVETHKANGRQRQKAYRDKQREKLAKAIGFVDTETGEVTGDVTRYLPGDVGKGKGEEQRLHEGSPQETSEEVKDWPVRKIPTSKESAA